MATRPRSKSRQGLWILRVGRAHLRLLISVAVGVVAFAALPTSLTSVTRMLIGWDVGVVLYLVAAFAMMARATVADIAVHAAAQDEGALALLLLSIAAAATSLGAIFVILALDKKALDYGFQTALAIGTVVLSWAFIHTIMALHYAYEFYGEHGRADGLKFPGGEKPDYWDFVYFSFVIGMTFQVSDVGITNKLVRRTVVAHGVLAFFFTTSIVALAVNVAANAIQR